MKRLHVNWLLLIMAAFISGMAFKPVNKFDRYEGLVNNMSAVTQDGELIEVQLIGDSVDLNWLLPFNTLIANTSSHTVALWKENGLLDDYPVYDVLIFHNKPPEVAERDAISTDQ